MRRLIIAIAVASLVPTVSLAAHDDYKGRGGGRKVLMEDINLDSNQLKQVRKFRSETRKRMIKTKSEIGLVQIDFQEELHKDKPDKAKLDKLINEIAELQAEMTRTKLGMQVKMTGILTPEQKQKILERMDASAFGGHDRRPNDRDRGGSRRHGDDF